MSRKSRSYKIKFEKDKAIQQIQEKLLKFLTYIEKVYETQIKIKEDSICFIRKRIRVTYSVNEKEKQLDIYYEKTGDLLRLYVP